MKIICFNKALTSLLFCAAFLQTSVEVRLHTDISMLQRQKKISRSGSLTEGNSMPTLTYPSQLLRFVERIAVDNTVILAQASCGYLDFAENWMIHIQALNISNYLVIADDDAAFAYLNAMHPGHVFLLQTKSEDPTQGGRSFIHIRTKYFNEMMCERLLVQRSILDGGFNFVWSDMDTVWFQDISKLMPTGFDFVGVDDAPYGYFRRNEQETDHVCGCMTFWAPTPVSKDTLHEWHSRCINSDGDDQAAFAEWWKSGLKDTLSWYIMPRQLFPSGALLDHVKIDFTPSEDPQSPHALLPAFIHANHRVGSESKRKFLQERLAWRIDSYREVMSCI